MMPRLPTCPHPGREEDQDAGLLLGRDWAGALTSLSPPFSFLGAWAVGWVPSRRCLGRSRTEARLGSPLSQALFVGS